MEPEIITGGSMPNFFSDYYLLSQTFKHMGKQVSDKKTGEHLLVYRSNSWKE